MNDKCYKYLQDILDASSDIATFVRELSFEQFDSSLLVQRAVEREFEIVGEALNRISRIDEDLFDSITDARNIVGFRNIIAHGYDIVDNRVLWSALSTNLPKLANEVKNLLNQ